MGLDAADLVQAVNHLANGAPKATTGRTMAAARVATLARGRLDRAFPGGTGRPIGLDANLLATAGARHVGY